MAPTNDWYESWIEAHVGRLGLGGKGRTELVTCLHARRQVLVGQRGATAARLAAVTFRCLSDTPTPRFMEHRWDAVCLHLKAVVVDEVKAAQAASLRAAAPAAAGGVHVETARKMAEAGWHGLARLALGLPRPTDQLSDADFAALYAAQGWHDLAAKLWGREPGPAPAAPEPAAGGDASFDPDEFDREAAP